jgi:hypothetical protein
MDPTAMDPTAMDPTAMDPTNGGRRFGVRCSVERTSAGGGLRGRLQGLRASAGQFLADREQ